MQLLKKKVIEQIWILNFFVFFDHHFQLFVEIRKIFFHFFIDFFTQNTPPYYRPWVAESRGSLRCPLNYIRFRLKRIIISNISTLFVGYLRRVDAPVILLIGTQVSRWRLLITLAQVTEVDALLRLLEGWICVEGLSSCSCLQMVSVVAGAVMVGPGQPRLVGFGVG